MLVAPQVFTRYEEAKLIGMLAGDSEAAFTAIYGKYQPRVYQVAMQFLKSPVLAQEVVQEVFMKLWVERRNVRTDAPVEAWLYTVAKNNILNRLRKMAVETRVIRQLHHHSIQENTSQHDQLKEADCQHLLNKALQSLSENQLKVYRLAKEENLSHLQIAEQLNISRLTVKTHMSRALKHLKLFFANY